MVKAQQIQHCPAVIRYPGVAQWVSRCHEAPVQLGASPPLHCNTDIVCTCGKYAICGLRIEVYCINLTLDNTNAVLIII